MLLPSMRPLLAVLVAFVVSSVLVQTATDGAAYAQQGRPPHRPSGQVTIPDPLDYLVQQNPDGSPMRVGDVLSAQRRDWPLPDGYVISQSLMRRDGTVTQVWDITPFGEFNAANGDGGQVASIGGDGYVRFLATQDGGTPWIQHFVGQNCGGTGWIVFRTDAVSGAWKSVVARLAIAQISTACPPLGESYTQWRIEDVRFPWAFDGVVSNKTLRTIISEHYDGNSIASSHALERSYLAKGYGLVRWEAWGPTPPAIMDLPERCGPIAYSDPPVGGWYLRDCRTFTNERSLVPPAPSPFVWP
jgi:hypothetical protein